MARLALFSWFPLVLLGPRIQVHEVGSLRSHEVVLLITVLILATKSTLSFTKPRTIRVSDLVIVLLGCGAGLFVLLTLGLSADNEVAIRLGFGLRYFELALIPVVVYRLLSSSGPLARSMELGFWFSLGVNFLWVLVQLVSGFRGPGWSFSSEPIAIYGAAMFGEASVFGSGQILFVYVAMLVATRMTRPTRLFGLNSFLLVVAFSLLAIVESRASIASSFLIVLVTVWSMAKKSPNLRDEQRAPLVVVITSVLIVVFLALNPRSGVNGVVNGVYQRWLDSYFPVIEAMSGNPLFGLGPGGFRAVDGGESHSVYFLILGDFGLLGLCLFFAGVIYLLRKLSSDNHTLFGGPSRRLRLFLAFFILNLLVAGIVQDSLLPVASNHTAASFVGLLVAHARAGEKPTVLNFGQLKFSSARGRTLGDGLRQVSPDNSD